MMNRRPPAIFVSGSRGLDFLNSIATPVDTPVDWLVDGEGYLSWLEQAQLVSDDILRDMKARALPGELDDLAGHARRLREWFRGFVDRHKGRPLAAGALVELGPLNDLLSRDQAFGRIVLSSTNDRRFRLEVLRRWREPDGLLLPVAEALADLVCAEDFSQVKSCERPGCTLLFVDHTRRHARRWCSMATCGNRSKQAAHRQRIKAD
jgi:predicted RNA-binding Zn ribbon-like protein